MAEMDFRLTLMSPGAFTDEGLGGGKQEDGRWLAVFKRPVVPKYAEYIEMADYDVWGCGRANTASVAICQSALRVMKMLAEEKK